MDDSLVDICWETELTSWLSAYAVLLNVVLIVCVPFPYPYV